LLLATTKTLCFLDASSSAMARPIPLLAPVINANDI
jgi:hypothetical protein